MQQRLADEKHHVVIPLMLVCCVSGGGVVERRRCGTARASPTTGERTKGENRQQMRQRLRRAGRD